MSTWDERFENHPARAALEQLEQLLAGTRSIAESESSALENWERINRVTNYARKKFNSADPLLVSPTNLTNITASLQSLINELATYQTDRNVGHLINANTYLDSTLYHYAGLPDPKTVDDISDLREAAASYRKSIGQLTKNLQDEISTANSQKDTLQQKLQELTNEISNQKARLDNAITQFQQLFTAAQELRQNEFAASQSKNFELFSTSEEERKSDFNTFIDNANTIFQEAQTKFLTQNKESLDKFNNNAEILLEELEEKREHAKKLIGIITDTGMVHGYQTTANEERNASRWWQGGAVASLSIWIILGCIFFVRTYDQELSWTVVVRQLLISTPFILLAGFAAMQASQHQRVERTNRRTELEIASIDPFLATLDDEERNDVKRSLVDKFFGQRESDTQKSELKRMLSLITDLAKTIQQIQGALKK